MFFVDAILFILRILTGYSSACSGSVRLVALAKSIGIVKNMKYEDPTNHARSVAKALRKTTAGAPKPKDSHSTLKITWKIWLI